MKLRNIIHAGLFQATWFGCVVGQVTWGIPGLLAMLLFSAVVGSIRGDLKWAFWALLVGLFLDSLWIVLGILDFSGRNFAPIWICMLWIAVGLSINHTFRFFFQRPILGGFLAGCSAPGCYLVGESFGSVVIIHPMMLSIISLVWFAVFYFSFLVAADWSRSTAMEEQA
tara:strand:+ start:234 stop:740 length:507 start_codon:yes stop_codon:yes gene_type:complete